MKERVLLGMSGGVDSSVSAILLQKQGYEVVGVTMKLWDKKDSNLKDTAIADAQNVCERLGIEHYVVDLQKEFEEKVVNDFIRTYIYGKTPNPCIECNKFIKFGEFYNLAKKYNCKYIATGHYAKIVYSELYNQHVLCKSNAKLKDQTYFLYGINKEILPYILFPLSDFEDKDEIRNIALEAGLEIAKKKDSQEICFIENNNYIDFLKRNMINVTCSIKQQLEDNIMKDKKKSQEVNINHDKQGNIVLKDGKVLGKHSGLINYTIGQRKGLGISFCEPLYVIRLNTEANEVVVGTEEELYSKSLKANELNFLLDVGLKDEIEIEAKVRYRSKPAKAILHLKGDIALVEFEESQRAITPGQSVVFYLGDIILGGGKII